MRIQHVGIDHTLEIPDIGAKRLTITYASGDNHPELRLEGVLIASGTSTTLGSKYDMIISVDHPYAANGGTYIDESSTYDNESGATYAIVSNYGGASNGLLDKRQKLFSKQLYLGEPDTAEHVLGESLNVMGLTWMKEVRLTDQILSEVAETVAIRHHTIGRMAQEAGYYIDIKTATVSIISRHSTPEGDSDREAHFFINGSLASSYEHGVLEQKMGSDHPGVSTIKLLDAANSQGKKVFYANSANFSSVKTQLVNYEGQIANLQNIVSSGRYIILPGDGSLNLGVGTWEGTGYISKWKSGGSLSIGMIISGGYAGGFNAEPAYVYESYPTFEKSYLVDGIDLSQSVEYINPTSIEPVDLATGAYLFDHTDISLGGQAPMGLSFNRSYNSALNLQDSVLGYGWTHNYDMRINQLSNGDPGLGLRLPVDAAPAIVELFIALDLLKNQDDLQGWMAMALSHKWLVDQMIDNVRSVRIGTKILSFVERADGGYTPPPGITTKLIDNGDNTFSLEERFGTKMDFDTQDRISKITDVDSNEMDFAYVSDKLSTVTDAFSRTLTLGYTGEKLDSVSDTTGRSVSYNIDGNGDLATFTDLDSKVWSYGYDTHRMTTLQDPLGITSATNTYDPLDRVDTQTAPRQIGNAVYNFYFSGFRNVEEDPYGNQTIYHFDNKGRTISVENALGYKSSTEYDGHNHVVKTTDPRSNSSTFDYDGNHNLTNIINALTEETVNTYDGLLRLEKITLLDLPDHITQFDYDSEHHLELATDAENNTIGASYYANGQVNTTTDGRFVQTAYTYDSYGNPDTTQTAGHPIVGYDFDPVGRMNSLSDQEGATTSFVYKDSGLVEQRTDPLLKDTISIYDDAGRVSFVTDRNLDDVEYLLYTPTGKPEKIRYPDLSEVNFVYDQHDKLISMTTDSVGAADFVYDELYRLDTMTDENGFAVSYEYDEANNLTKITYPGNKTVSYTYDALNRLKTVTIDWLGLTTTYTTYDEAGNLRDVTNFNGTTTTYGYDKADRLKSLENRKSDNSIISTYSFEILDGNGNREQIIQDEPLAPVVQTESLAYTYNIERNRLLTAGASVFSHDHEGQLSYKDGVSYDFDYEHRLVDVGGADSYTYNGVGVRLSATRSGEETRYIYDAAGNLLAEADNTGTITRYYIHGLGLLAVVTPSGQAYTYHFNAIGSTIAITDQSENMVNKYVYTPFGRLANEEETFPQSFKFVGKYGILAEPNGLYYMRARYFDSETGRFISEDPIGFAGGDFNLYAYVKNNPVMYVDPSGKVFLNGIAAGIGAFVGAGINAYSTWQGGGSGWEIAGSAALGAVAGGAAGLALNPAVYVGVNAAIGGAANVGDQLIGGSGIGGINPVEALIVAGSSAGGAAFSKFGGKLINAGKNTVQDIINDRTMDAASSLFGSGSGAVFSSIGSGK